MDAGIFFYGTGSMLANLCPCVLAELQNFGYIDDLVNVQNRWVSRFLLEGSLRIQCALFLLANKTDADIAIVQHGLQGEFAQYYARLASAFDQMNRDVVSIKMFFKGLKTDRNTDAGPLLYSKVKPYVDSHADAAKNSDDNMKYARDFISYINTLSPYVQWQRMIFNIRNYLNQLYTCELSNLRGLFTTKTKAKTLAYTC